MNRDASIRAFAAPSYRRNGMILMELLVGVAILALLMAILLPSLSLARQKARRMTCAANLRAVGHAFNLYKTSLGRYPCPGDRDPYKVFGSLWKPGVPGPFRPNTKLADIGDLAEALVHSSLGDPRALYCPSSLQSDPYAPTPYAKMVWNGRLISTWQTGQISYMYLVGLDYGRPESSFPDASGRPTFNPATESPERRVNRANSRAVLIGDRTVEIVPPNRSIPQSNHGREGGWFFFTTGDAQWWSWERLTAHPTVVYHWYWPRVGRDGAGKDGH